jgi:Amt family ammonium transporter
LSIVITTNLAASAGAIVTKFCTWMKYRKSDISMTLNAALAGLVGITAGCAAVSNFGAVAIGAICERVVVLSIAFIDEKLKIDDPVGAISVHVVCQALGTILVGLFAIDGGLFYGGGFSKLGIQTVGVLAIGAWAVAMTFIVLFILKKTMGLRVSERDETEGLDITEHGMNAYPDFRLNE